MPLGRPVNEASGARALREHFRRRHGREPRFAHAPGRVNLIGEHTDYNDGFALPVAIDLWTSVAFAPREEARWLVRSESFAIGVEGAPGDQVELRPDEGPRVHWSDYPTGVLRMLLETGVRVPGATLEFASDVPAGAGLSSSAALEVATANALLALAGEERDGAEIALLCQRAENEFVGMRCGIMDQLVSCLGRAGEAMLLDCRTRAVRFVPLPTGVDLVIVSSMVRHALAAGEYNARRSECEEAARILAEEAGRDASRPPSLRDATLADVEHSRSRMTDRVFRRARHVVTENERVLETVEALAVGDLERVGGAMARSHASLRDDFEVSCRELDSLVEIASSEPGVVGARMTGGGFGGCTVNLVRSASTRSFCEAVCERQAAATGQAPDLWVTSAVSGARVE